MSSVHRYKIGVSPLTGEIYLYRHGTDPSIALDKRPAEAEVMQAIASHMFSGDETEANAVMKSFKIGDQAYTLDLRKVDEIK